MDIAETRSFSYSRSHGSLKSTWSTALIIAFVIGLHLRLDIYAGGTIIVPAYICLGAVTGLAFLNATVVINQVVPFVAVVGGVAFTLAALAAGDTGDFVEVIKPSLQFTASIFAAVTFMISLRSLPSSHIRRLATALWLVFIFLSVVEVIALREIFNQISSFIYSGTRRILYVNDIRDVNIYGSIRAKSFASEPSYLSYTLSTLAIIRFIADDNSTPKRRVALLILMFSAAYVIAPSLSATFFLSAALVWWFWPTNTRQIVLLLSGAVLTAALLALLAGELIANPPTVVRSHMESGSFMGRVLIGPPAALKVLAQHPLIGLGIGNDVDSYPFIAEEWSIRGGFARFPWYAGFNATDLMSNGFWWQWIYFGLAGGLVILTLVARMLEGLGVSKPFRAIFCAWIVWYAGAQVVAPYSWVLVGIFALSTGAFQKGMPVRADAHRVARATPD